MKLDAQFVESSRGRILCVGRFPAEQGGSPVPAVLVVPPFAEEMNKCRRMITVFCEALAERGIASVVPDLFGTGDSEGRFSDASWEAWLDDLDAASAWAAEQQGTMQGVLGVRSGCVLAADWLRRSGHHPACMVLWQPVNNLTAAVKPLLRVRALQSQMNGGRETSDGLLGELLGGTGIDAAGYSLPPDLLRASQDLELTSLLSQLSDIHPHRLLVSRLVGAVKHGGDSLEETYPGDPYWSSVEISCNQSVVARSVDLFTESLGSVHG
jgi:exosortase A-associated hydrolase 2